MRSACLYGSSLGLCWAQVVPMLGQVGPMLSHHLGRSLGLCWAKSGSGPSWAYMLGSSWAHVGPMLGLCWAHVGLCWAYVGPCWALLGAMLGPCLGHLCWNALKMPFFLPWSPTPRKNWCFSTSPRWFFLPLKGPKHSKKRCFLTPQARRHRVGGRGGSAYNLRLPPGGRQGHGMPSWPAPGFRGLRLTGST